MARSLPVIDTEPKTPKKVNHDLQKTLVPSSSKMEQDHPESILPKSVAVIRFKVRSSRLKLNHAYYAEPIRCQNLMWNLFIVPEHCNNTIYLGVFVECHLDPNDEKENLYKSWRCHAAVIVKLLSQKEEEESSSSDIYNRLDYTFGPNCNDQGWRQFVSEKELQGSDREFYKNGFFILEAHIKADPPHFAGWPSRKYTGFVGLHNQGATCYMNSLLQSLYFTNQLRQAVYKIPTKTTIADSKETVSLALQRVFYKLQTSDKPVYTQELTASLGWNRADCVIQQDVQEFFRIFLDGLETRMKGTCVEGMIPKLFEGKMISYVKCKNVEVESFRLERFYDIQLNIQNKKDIHEAFASYVAPQVLDGDNKYDAGLDHGLQDAEKGVIFESFPPVLHLHLLRFQYNHLRRLSIKSNDRFEFSEHINLDKYLRNPSSSTKASYTLQAVLVHRGYAGGGHYVVFIDPKGDGNWYKFDDDVVSPSTKTEAIQYNFGGLANNTVFHPGIQRSTNAYMLVYIRDSELATVLQDVGENDLPSELLELFKEEDIIKELSLKQGKYDDLQLQVLTEDAFVGHQGPQLYDHKNYNPAVFANSRIFKIYKRAKPYNLLQCLTETYGVDKKRLRLWPFSEGLHGLLRPMYLNMNEYHSHSLEESKIGQKYPIFLEMLPADDEKESLPPYNEKADILVFFKMYDAARATLHYRGHSYVPLQSSCNVIVAECRGRAKWPSDEPITLYEEIGVRVEKIRNYNVELSSAFENVNDGVIVIFHQNLNHSKKFTSLQQYYSSFTNNRKFE